MHIYFSIVNFQRVETEDGRTAGVQHQILEDGLSPIREVCHFFFIWLHHKQSHMLAVVRIRNDLLRIQLWIFRVSEPHPVADPDPTYIIEAYLELWKK